MDLRFLVLLLTIHVVGFFLDFWIWLRSLVSIFIFDMFSESLFLDLWIQFLDSIYNTVPTSLVLGFIFSQPRHQSILSLVEEGKKDALEHFKHVIKICLNRRHIFQNKLRNMWVAKGKMLFLLPLHISKICRAKNESKINIPAESDIL